MNQPAPPAHPRAVLFADGAPAPDLPVCDHYCGTEPRMRKALALQAERGPAFDVTLDCEDGAPVGGEKAHAELCVDLLTSAANRHGRVGVRIHPLGHRAFDDDVRIVVGRAAQQLAYVMLPKPRHLRDVQDAVAQIGAAATRAGRQTPLPVHTLIETHGALRDVFAIAEQPHIASLSFGLMDFVSAHRGAIPATAMGVTGQFEHPLVLRAKIEIAAACHAFGKTPSHCVVTEFTDLQALGNAVSQARHRLGYTRMWSIHPAQIEPIIQGFAPSAAELDEAAAILQAAQAAQWAPVRFHDKLHDRASYRYFWQMLERAHASRVALPSSAEAWFA